MVLSGDFLARCGGDSGTDLRLISLQACQNGSGPFESTGAVVCLRSKALINQISFAFSCVEWGIPLHGGVVLPLSIKEFGNEKGGASVINARERYLDCFIIFKLKD